MAEIKQTFTAGKMNKDFDERLVPSGEYRDAMNIQVKTTDSGAAGVVQNLQSNEESGMVYLTTNLVGDKTKAIGSVSDERNNKGYFLFASPDIVIPVAGLSSAPSRVFYVDSILEQDSKAIGVNTPVVVDIFGLVEPRSSVVIDHSTNPKITQSDTSDYRVGMEFKAYALDSNNNIAKAGTRIVKIEGSYIYLSELQDTNLSAAAWYTWECPKTLEFDYKSRITGLNIIDDYLFYTDNLSEPKKVNIPRCKQGSVGSQPTLPVHTKLFVKGNGDTLLQSSEFVGDLGHLDTSHLTVIRKAPRTAPSISMKSSSRDGDTEYTITEQNFTAPILYEGYELISVPMPDGVDLLIGDKIKLVCTNDHSGTVSTIRGTRSVNTPDGFVVVISSKSNDILTSHTDWVVSLEESGKRLFELKFPRFGYRYKYEDNEYSSFSPWSEIAFIPGDFNYTPKEGYNLGMTNKLKKVTITNLLQDDKVRPDDIKAIDILYKSADSPTVYVVKTIEKDVDPEWDTTQLINDSNVVITSEMIHKAVPSDQILRSWDNVPRLAKAQEIVSNRLIYGNYTQGYNMPTGIAINQTVISKPVAVVLKPEKSVKSLRSYKFGLVVGDEYGRETPVTSVGTRVRASINGATATSSDSTSVDKVDSLKSNKFSITQDWSGVGNAEPAAWMNYAKYYVKETSGEYYNLTMDRYYDAADGNVWISFPSSERNKIDEDTYLILKNEHGSQEAVEEEARYKVVAINNEAPDFIKTESSEVDSALVHIGFTGSTVAMSPLTSSIFLDLAEGGSIGNYEPKGTLKARIGVFDSTNGQHHYTTKITVTNNVLLESDEINLSRLHLKEAFGAQADFPGLLVELGTYADRASAWSAINGTWKVELFDEVKNSRPEFDGRFFVKINNDTTLEQRVLNGFKKEQAFTVLRAFNFAYIDTSNYNNQALQNTETTQANDHWDYNFNAGIYDSSLDLTAFGDGVYPYDNLSVFFDVYHNTIQSTNDLNAAVFIDNAGISANSSNANFSNVEDYYSNSRGFAKSGNDGVDNTTFDKLYLSYTKLSSLSSSGNNSSNEVFTHMIAAGTYFRFRNDPHQSVYVTVVDADADIYGGAFWKDFTRRVTRSATFRKVSPLGEILSEGININDWDPRGDMHHDGSQVRTMEILTKVAAYDGGLNRTNDSAIWETEPREGVDLDLYYEASNALPIKLTDYNTVEFAPVGVKVAVSRFGVPYTLSSEAVVNSIVGGGVLNILNSNGLVHLSDADRLLVNDILSFTHSDGTITSSKVLGYATFSDGIIVDKPAEISAQVNVGITTTLVELTSGNCESNNITNGMLIRAVGIVANTTIVVGNPGDNWFTLSIASTNSTALSNYPVRLSLTANYTPTGNYILDKDVYKYPVELPWFNCYSYGNGVESNRIRDDYNKPFINNGVKVSSTIEDYQEDKKYNSLIYSNIYNANSSVNGLNEFNMSQVITKDLNPSYGKIQALKTRDTDITVFTEDKVLRVLANKDALFNADGNTNVTASNRVLGQAVPYVGDYGISNNPESLAWDQYRMYFTDKQRGAVLRLSRDGITPISNIGMNNWFRDHLAKSKLAIGSFDKVNGEYNLSMSYDDVYQLDPTTLSFNEAGKGWVSFKSFIQDVGESFGGKYFTAKANKTWVHYSDETYRNNFYETSTGSSVNVIFNDYPDSVKSFEALKFEGSHGNGASVNNHTYVDVAGNSGVYNDNEHSKLTTTSASMSIDSGWKAESVVTDIETGQVNSFVEREGKWFGYISGDFNTSTITVDESDFATQGLGVAVSIAQSALTQYEITIQEGPE